MLGRSHVEVQLRDPGIEEAGGFFMLLQENKSVCMHRKQRLHSREKDEGRGRGLICGSVGEKEGRGNKKKEALGLNMGETRYTAELQEKEKVSQGDGRSIPPMSPTANRLLFFLFLSPSA